MDKNRAKMTRELIRTSKSIKRKYDSLKADQRDEMRQREQAYTPITEPLKKIIKQSKIHNTEIKSEKRSNNEDESYMKIKQPMFLSDSIATQHNPETTLNQPEFIDSPVIAESAPEIDTDPEDDDEQHSYEDGISKLRNVAKSNKQGFEEFLGQYNKLPRFYLQTLIDDTGRKIDYTYGIRYNPELDSWAIGSTPIKIDKNDLIIGDKRYLGTAGLYELLFMAHPMAVTQADRDAYQEILEQTNLHRRSALASGRIIGSKGYKYKNIIQPLLKKKISDAKPKTKTPRTSRLHTWAGESLIRPLLKKKISDAKPKKTRTSVGVHTWGANMKYNDRPVEYVFWNDVVELISRLRLLYTAKLAGNNNNFNEILSIINELQEADVIY
jgi:hypothetical protein